MNRWLKALLVILVLTVIGHSALCAEDESKIDKVARKCDENSQLLKSIDKGQQEILRQLKEIREELNVIKVRATR